MEFLFRFSIVFSVCIIQLLKLQLTISSIWKLKESYKLCDIMNYVYSVLEMILEIPHYESVLL